MTRVASWANFYRSSRTVSDMLRWSVTHEQLLAELIGLGRVLEVGTGTAMLSTLASGFTELSVTLDNSEEVLCSARELVDLTGSTVPMVLGDAMRLPFMSGSFHAIYTQGLLEHFQDSQIREMVDEHLRVAPVVYASVPSKWYPHLGRRGPGLRGDERLLRARTWVSILGDFAVEARYYSDFKIATLAGRTLPWPAQLLLTIARRR